MLVLVENDNKVFGVAESENPTELGEIVAKALAENATEIRFTDLNKIF